MSLDIAWTSLPNPCHYFAFGHDSRLALEAEAVEKSIEHPDVFNWIRPMFTAIADITSKDFALPKL
jgi:hypothetical protein